MTAEHLAQMRAYADEVRADLREREQHERENPTFDPPPPVTREAPLLVRKVTTNGNGVSDNDEPAPLLSADEIGEVVAEEIVELEARLTAVEIRLETLMSLLGADTSKSVRSKRRR